MAASPGDGRFVNGLIDRRRLMQVGLVFAGLLVGVGFGYLAVRDVEWADTWSALTCRAASLLGRRDSA